MPVCWCTQPHHLVPDSLVRPPLVRPPLLDPPLLDPPLLGPPLLDPLRPRMGRCHSLSLGNGSEDKRLDLQYGSRCREEGRGAGKGSSGKPDRIASERRPHVACGLVPKELEGGSTRDLCLAITLQHVAGQ